METSFAHHGVVGMKWGVRRYQNKDGTLTAEGRKRQSGESSAKKPNTASKTAEAVGSAKSSNKVDGGQGETSAKKQDVGSKLTKTTESSKAAKKVDKAKAAKKVEAPQPTYKTLSDDELRARISRLELEKRYKELARNPTKKSKGKDFVMDVLEKSGKNIATQLSTYAMGSLVNKLAGQEIVNPKKGQKDK